MSRNGGDAGSVGFGGQGGFASELFIKLFGEVNGKHARTAIGVAELPLNAPVEVEVLVQLKS